MKIEKISYQKTFSIGPYLTDKVGIEVSMDEKDNVDSILSQAKTIVERWHKEANPHLYNNPQLQKTLHSMQDIALNEFDKGINKLSFPEINLQDEKKLITIENAKTWEELALVKDGILPGTDLMKQYMNKMRGLTK